MTTTTTTTVTTRRTTTITDTDITTATTTVTTTAINTVSIKGVLTIKNSCSNDPSAKFLEGKMYSTTSRISSEVTLTRFIAESDHTTVYEAISDGKEVVMKFKFGLKHRDSLKREAKLYRGKLRNFQGSVIPLFYGYYSGRLNRKLPDKQEREIACIVLENCGKRVPEFDCLSYEQRLDIFDLMVKLHRHGYHQYDFDAWNVCFKDGKFRLVDLGMVEPHAANRTSNDRSCAWKGDRQQLNIGGDFPHDSVPCRYLIITGSKMHFWLSSPLKHQYLRGAMVTRDLDQLPSRIIVDKLLPSGYRLDCNKEDMVVAWLKDVKKELDMCSDEKAVEDLIRRRADEFPKEWLRRILF